MVCVVVGVMCGCRWFVLLLVLCVVVGVMWLLLVLCVVVDGLCCCWCYVWLLVLCVVVGVMCGCRWFVLLLE